MGLSGSLPIDSFAVEKFLVPPDDLCRATALVGHGSSGMLVVPVLCQMRVIFYCQYNDGQVYGDADRDCAKSLSSLKG